MGRGDGFGGRWGGAGQVGTNLANKHLTNKQCVQVFLVELQGLLVTLRLAMARLMKNSDGAFQLKDFQ